MIWFFEKETERLHYEIRRDDGGEGYELVISAPAEEKIEKVESPTALIERSQHVWTNLLDGGWRPLQHQSHP